MILMAVVVKEIISGAKLFCLATVAKFGRRGKIGCRMVIPLISQNYDVDNGCCVGHVILLSNGCQGCSPNWVEDAHIESTFVGPENVLNSVLHVRKVLHLYTIYGPTFSSQNLENIIQRRAKCHPRSQVIVNNIQRHPKRHSKYCFWMTLDDGFQNLRPVVYKPFSCTQDRNVGHFPILTTKT